MQATLINTHILMNILMTQEGLKLMLKSQMINKRSPVEVSECPDGFP